MTTGLARMLNPTSVAVVGASEQRTMSNVAVGQLLDAPVDLHLVNPKGGTAYGQRTVTSLRAIGHPVDTVLSLVSAEKAVAVVEEAGQTSCGGVVVVAGGFAEIGPPGQEQQDRLVAAARAAGLPLCGPNCTGFANVTAGVDVFTGTHVDVRSGGIALISSSGYLMRSAMVAAQERGLGMRLAISAGNEAVTTLVDYVDYLVADPQTTLIAVIAEKLRDPAGFFAAAARARAARKPLIVLKLGRSTRARDIVRSHTGALTGESWVYDLAFRDAGIIAARDLDDVMDRAMILAQLAPSSWRSVERIAVLASSGGVAALTCDTVADEPVELPALDALGARIREFVPGATVVNPLDLTGFTLSDPSAVTAVLETYRDSAEVDAVVVGWWLGDADEQRAELLLDPARKVAAGGEKPVILSTVETSRVGSWTADTEREGVAFGRGLRGTVRALRAMHDYVTARPRTRHASGPLDVIARPSGVVATAAGPMLPFAASMELLTAAGIPVAPWVVLADPARWSATALGAAPGAFVVKLADVPHRTELGAVRLPVAANEVPAVAAELGALARRHGVPTDIAVQRLATGDGEAFIGYQADSDLGPAVMAGLGGVLVELTASVVGRLLPIDDQDVDELLTELGGASVFAGLRGGEPWNRDTLAAVLRAAAELGQRCSPWLVSLDLNPIICSASGCTAVDALFLCTSSS